MPSNRLRVISAALLLCASSICSAAIFFEQVFSNASGSVQFIALRLDGAGSDDHLLAGRTLTVIDGTHVRTFVFASDLPDSNTNGRRVLVASGGFASLGLVSADATLPDRFLPTTGATLRLSGAADFTYPALPTDGVNAYYATTPVAANVATNFAGQSASVPAAPVTAIEYHNAAFDHYFVSSLAPDIAGIEAGRIQGWSRTGRGFLVFPSAASGGSGVNPVCRFYIPPQHGDSHFFSASPAECNEILGKIVTDPNYSGYVHESPNAFYAALPNTGTGACPAGTVPVYRLWNQRADSNHRYTTDAGIKAAMVGKGYVAEGYGADAVSLCSPAAVLTDALVRASGNSPFTAGCDNVPAAGTVFLNSEVEPFIAVNPVDPNNFIGVWQQDRWSSGGSRGAGVGFTFDGGGTWAITTAPFSRCGGGNANNGGDYARASDPWVTIAPDGVAYQSALAFNGGTFVTGSSNAILVSRSIDGGRTWGNVTTVLRDGSEFFNDKESITADSTDARYVYATWDRLARLGGGPTWFARTADGGASWEPARSIYDPGLSAQTIGNVIVVLPDGSLVNLFTELTGGGPATGTLRVIRSTDKGATWSAPITIAPKQSVGTRDPETGAAIRDGTLLGAIAAGRDGTLAVVWQDARFSGGTHDGIAFSRSSDGGLTWSSPLRVNGSSAVAAFVPSVTVRDDGTIGVTYYDFRSNTSDANTLLSDYWLATSVDGVTWQERHIAGPFDVAQAPLASEVQPFLGDYAGLASVGTTFLPFFSQATGDPTDRSNVMASLARAPSAVPVAKQERAFKAASAPLLASTPALAERIDRAIREALHRRIPGWTLQGFVPGR